MKTEEQTSIHLLLASIVTVFDIMLILTTIAMSWEPWMIPIIVIGSSIVWFLHIGRAGSNVLYENLCIGLLMIVFFFGVHGAVLFDVSAVACLLILIFSMFDRKRLLYLMAALYLLVFLYHFLILRTISYGIGFQNAVHLGIGVMVVTGAALIARVRIDRRNAARKKYDNTLVQLETAGRQNAEFMSNVSHEIRTPINMVPGISEVALEKDLSPELREDILPIKMAGKRLSNQINNILDYTEIMEGTLTSA